MGWYKQAQVSQQEAWWDQFYHHMTNTAEFILQDAGIVIDAHKNSINDGQRANFMMKASYGGKSYVVRIQLEFSERLTDLQFGPLGTGRLEGISQPAENLLRSTVTVMEGGMRIVDQQQFSQSDPSSLMTAARDIILGDNEPEAYSDYDPAEPEYQ